MTKPVAVAPEPVSSPHGHRSVRVGALMWTVVLALVPVLAAYVWYFGWGVPVSALLIGAAAWLWERLALRLRGRSGDLFRWDGSVMVLGLLLALSLPPYLPWWQGVLGAAFAVLVAKHAYGGLGGNLFNPAMAGCVFVLLCFPTASTLWPAGDAVPGLMDTLRLIFGGLQGHDAISGASPLDAMRTQLRLEMMMSELRGSTAMGSVGAAHWEVINAVVLGCGIALLAARIITWHIPAATLAGIAGAALLLYLYDSDGYLSPAFHLFSGASMMAAFFIATDPISSPVTPRAKIVYGLGVGAVTVAVRTWGGFPDGVAFAVLFMNAWVPALDRWFKPRVFGT